MLLLIWPEQCIAQLTLNLDFLAQSALRQYYLAKRLKHYYLEIAMVVIRIERIDQRYHVTIAPTLAQKLLSDVDHDRKKIKLLVCGAFR